MTANGFTRALVRARIRASCLGLGILVWSGSQQQGVALEDPPAATDNQPAKGDGQKESDGDPAAERVLELPTMEITGTRLVEDPFFQPYAFYRIDRDLLDRTIGRTPLDRVNYGPGVFIQRTAPNQASPFVRGLTGEQSLLLLDGVRFNHAFMRPGPNQYSALIPGASLSSVDVILGSSSVVNGSDGLTGAVDFNLAPAGRGVDKAFSPWARTRVDSANGATLQFGVDGNTDNWAFSFEFERQDFHDRVGGKDFEDHVFGINPNTVDEIPNTAYVQTAYGVRLAYFGIEDHVFELNSGYAIQNDAPRPDGYFENTGNPARISRRFDPQSFSYVHLRDRWHLGQSWIDELRTTVWFHHHYEDQKREELRNAGTATESYRRRELEDGLYALGLDLQATTRFTAGGAHEFTWGVTGIHENTNNDFQEFRTPDGTTNPFLASPFEPENWDNRTTVSDDSDYKTYGVFAQDSWDLCENFNLLSGIRYSQHDWSFGNVDGDASDLTGSLRGRWQYREDQNIFAGVSKGFRAPNLTNLDGAVDRGSSGTEAQGNPDLDPEISYTAEVGWRWRRGRDQLGVTTFYTLIDDLIQQDFSGAGEFTNVEDGKIKGFEIVWDYGLPCVPLPNEEGRLAFFGSTSLVDATKDIPQPGGGTRTDNISRANRLYGQVGFQYDHDSSWWARTQVRWHDAYDDVADDPSDSDANDIRLTIAGSPDGSMPGYGVVDLQAGWRSEDGRVELMGFIENLFNKTYREPGSGVDGPGLNVGISAGVRY